MKKHTPVSAIRDAGVNVQTGAKLVASRRAVRQCVCAGYNAFVYLGLRIICITISLLQLRELSHSLKMRPR